MAQTLRRRLIDWGLAALFLLIPALVLRASLRRPSELGAVDQAVLRVSAPLQSGVAWMVRRIGSVWHGYVALVGVEDENRELRAENERLRRELSTMTRKAFDLEALEELALLRKQIPADTIGARVVATALSPAFRVVRLRIDRGEGEVEPGMPVITSEGLAGKILTVYGRHADVLLLTDTRMGVPIVVKRTGGLGQLHGVGASDRYACKIDWLDRGSSPDDVVNAQGRRRDLHLGLALARRQRLPGRHPGRARRQGLDQGLLGVPGGRGDAGGVVLAAAHGAGAAGAAAAAGPDRGQGQAQRAGVRRAAAVTPRRHAATPRRRDAATP
ncbi:MAG: rod shape-determining protein MreC [Myxococcales bacterium]|nr:rod shape-determining protein MreC [Myxococcales bacterium]